MKQDGLAFIDLFAGLGGFHLALAGLGHHCVFASELDSRLNTLYRENFSISAAGDIRMVEAAEIPSHDILCAGFPCQPFSKAGTQAGLDHPMWGDLFYHILRILDFHQPRFFILENVPNVERHNFGKTWAEINVHLRHCGYDVQQKRISPHHFGIPQIRDRMFIVADRLGMDGFQWPEKSYALPTLRSVLEVDPPEARPISEQVALCIAVWQEFLDQYPAEEDLPSFPVWGAEFGATYPYEELTPYALGAGKLRKYFGANGCPLGGLSDDEIFAALPSYARTQEDRFPQWKRTFIRQNRELYNRQRAWIDPWQSKILGFPASLQKFEWNAKGETRSLSDKVLQVRASGLRAKRPTTAPSLVAMTTTQVPIIAWENRYMTVRECARLQSMELLRLPDSATRAYSALGNAVNVQVVELIARQLIGREQPPVVVGTLSDLDAPSLCEDEAMISV